MCGINDGEKYVVAVMKFAKGLEVGWLYHSLNSDYGQKNADDFCVCGEVIIRRSLPLR